MRDCPVPLLLVKDPARLAGARIVACVDPMHAHDKPAALDVQLIRRGASLAELLGGELHALHVASLPVPVGLVGDAWVAAAAMPSPEELLSSAREACERLAAERGLSRSRLHLRLGAPASEIVAAARELGAGLLVMGVVSRRRLERWFVGNTAEAVLDRAPCNLWVEKPASAGGGSTGAERGEPRYSIGHRVGAGGVDRHHVTQLVGVERLPVTRLTSQVRLLR